MTTPTATDPLVRYTDDGWVRPISPALLAARRNVMAAVRELATITDADLATPWTWKGGSEDEIRYGFYRIFEDFERAGIDAEAAIRAAGVERGRAADLIAPATSARWDLQGILVQLPDAAWDADPGGGEWTVRQTLGHVIGGQRGYGAATAWWQAQALPANDDLPTERPPVYDDLPGDREEAAGTPAEVRARLDEVLDQSTELLAGLPPDRLALGTRWAGFAVDIGFRLGRWSSHMREHTIQVEKTLLMIGHTPTEVDRLIRLILGAWGGQRPRSTAQSTGEQPLARWPRRRPPHASPPPSLSESHTPTGGTDERAGGSGPCPGALRCAAGRRHRQGCRGDEQGAAREPRINRGHAAVAAHRGHGRVDRDDRTATGRSCTSSARPTRSSSRHVGRTAMAGRPSSRRAACMRNRSRRARKPRGRRARIAEKG